MLDTKTKVLVWYGESSTNVEREAADALAEQLVAEHRSQVRAEITHLIDDHFWAFLASEQEAQRVQFLVGRCRRRLSFVAFFSTLCCPGFSLFGDLCFSLYLHSRTFALPSQDLSCHPWSSLHQALDTRCVGDNMDLKHWAYQYIFDTVLAARPRIPTRLQQEIYSRGGTLKDFENN